MIGVPKTMVNKTMVMAVPSPNMTGIPQKDGTTVFEKGVITPIPQAAMGPDYGVGDPYYPVWHPNVLQEEHLVFVPSTYGQNGGDSKMAWQNGEYNGGDGSTEGSTGKVRTLKWDPEPLPGFDPRIQQWNILPPNAYYRGRLPSVKANASYGASASPQTGQAPLVFSAAGVASLVQSGLKGN